MTENRNFNSLLKNIKIYKNPTKERFISLITTDLNYCVRAIITENDIYCWKGSSFIHQDVIDYLQIIYDLKLEDILANIIFDNDKKILIYKSSNHNNMISHKSNVEMNSKDVYIKKYINSVTYMNNTISICIEKELPRFRIKNNDNFNYLIDIYSALLK